MTSAVSQLCAIQKGNRPMPELTAPTTEIQFLQEQKLDDHTHPAQWNSKPGLPFAQTSQIRSACPALGIPLKQPHRSQACKWPKKVNSARQVQPSEREAASIRKHCVSQQGRQASSFPGKVHFPQSRDKGCGGRKYSELGEENRNAPTL